MSEARYEGRRETGQWDEGLYIEEDRRERERLRGRRTAAVEEETAAATVEEIQRRSDDDGMGRGVRGFFRRRRERRRKRRDATAAKAVDTEAQRVTSAGRSKADYIDRRLAVLSERVSERLRSLGDEEDELTARRQEAAKKMRQVRAQLDSSGEVTISDEAAVESRGQRNQYASLVKLYEQLRARRTGVWEAMDEAEVRIEEIEAVRRTLRRRGIGGLQSVLERSAVSQSLRTYLQKLI